MKELYIAEIQNVRILHYAQKDSLKSFAKVSILYVDKTRYIPLYMEIHDEKGLYEQYEYKNVKLNPQFAPDEFTRNYFEYKF